MEMVSGVLYLEALDTNRYDASDSGEGILYYLYSLGHNWTMSVIDEHHLSLH